LKPPRKPSPVHRPVQTPVRDLFDAQVGHTDHLCDASFSYRTHAQVVVRCDIRSDLCVDLQGEESRREEFRGTTVLTTRIHVSAPGRGKSIPNWNRIRTAQPLCASAPRGRARCDKPVQSVQVSGNSRAALRRVLKLGGCRHMAPTDCQTGSMRCNLLIIHVFCGSGGSCVQNPCNAPTVAWRPIAPLSEASARSIQARFRRFWRHWRSRAPLIQPNSAGLHSAAPGPLYRVLRGAA
jgi:hypothetical protein